MQQVAGATSGGVDREVDRVNILRIGRSGRAERASDHVVAEQPLTIMIHQVGSFTIMCTPSDIEALAVGFTYSERMIDSAEDVIGIHTKPDLPNAIGLEVKDPSRIAVGRNLIIASSCGMCGSRNIDKMLTDVPPCDVSLHVTDRRCIDLTEQLRSRQKVFGMTGASHAAAIFDNNGSIIAFAEDVGRHNAVDKAVGKCLLAKQSTRGCGLVLSGRVTLEIVTKTARAGIELIVAVSAVSSFAVEAAKRWKITLCGFVRPDKINVYSIPERVRSNQQDARRMMVT